MQQKILTQRTINRSHKQKQQSKIKRKTKTTKQTVEQKRQPTMEYKKVQRKHENKNKTAKQENTQNKQNEIARKASNAETDINTQGHRTKVQKKKTYRRTM